MIEITGIFTFKDGRKVVSADSPWEAEVYHKIGDILVCGDKKWQVTAVDRFFQGCFGIPKTRHHGLILKPIGHEEQPEKGNILVKE